MFEALDSKEFIFPFSVCALRICHGLDPDNLEVVGWVVDCDVVKGWHKQLNLFTLVCFDLSPLKDNQPARLVREW